MQGYWLYSRYEYSLHEYESGAQANIEKILVEYNKLRATLDPNTENLTTTRTINNLNIDVDSLGKQVTTATVKTRVFNASRLLGITKKRELTEEEMNRLAKLVEDSLLAVDTKIASFDASSAPNSGAVWNAMNNFELNERSPFTVDGIDSLLRKNNINADISLIVADSIIWKAASTPHTSIINPHFTIEYPYSELERKTVLIDCKIPTTDVMREMGWTFVMALLLSIFLLVCLVWQINTIVKLARLDKMRNMFVTTMIHELKRPISTLKICTSGIENDIIMKDAGFRKEMTRETRLALDSLSAYFSKMRDITFNNVDQIPLNVASLNLSTLVDSVIKSISIPSTKQVGIANEVPSEMEISADISHMSNILTNLIENAIKYSGDMVSIKINAKLADGVARIDVADNGHGISSADRTKIFNRFYRGKASTTDIPGMGLGLTYVKLLVEAHCGEISVESDEGVGSTFSIKLPQ